MSTNQNPITYASTLGEVIDALNRPLTLSIVSPVIAHVVDELLLRVRSDDKLRRSIADAIQLEDLAGELDQEELAEEVASHINTSQLAEKVAESFESREIANEIDAEAIAEYIDADDVAEEMDHREVARRIDCKAVAEEFDDEQFARIAKLVAAELRDEIVEGKVRAALLVIEQQRADLRHRNRWWRRLAVKARLLAQRWSWR